MRLRETYDVYLVIADYHMLTTNDRPDNIKQVATHIRDLVLAYLSVGIDAKRSIIYVQSQVPQVFERQILLSMLMSVPRAQRIPTLKDVMVAYALTQPSLGLLSYPILQAADILLIRAYKVPVGKDQMSHVELCRVLARRFNHLFGNSFTEPEGLTGNVPVLVGTDGRAKMSKSRDNAI